MAVSEATSPEKITIFQHASAVDFLAVTYPTLRRHENTANIVLAHALERAPTDFVLTECQFVVDVDIELPSTAVPPPSANSFWLTVFAHPLDSKPVLAIVVSCLSSPLGNYPIFLWTPDGQSVSQDRLQLRMNALTRYLRACVEPERVFSIFGPADVTNSFAKVWTSLTGFQVAPEPLYTAFFAFCTAQTLKPQSVFTQGIVRRATLLDLETAALLCEEFSRSSGYPLESTRARDQAQALIRKGQLWVFEKDGEIASICAVTRSSLRVSAITKVYTTPKHRCNGFAQYLVQHVTQRLLQCGKHSVVLYVGVDNTAKRVYDRVGFDRSALWLELGFIGTHAGHW